MESPRLDIWSRHYSEQYYIWFSDKQSTRTDNVKEIFQKIRRPHTTTWTCKTSALKECETTVIRNLRNDLYNITPVNTRHNMSSAERNTIRGLKNQSNWIIKLADKGSGKDNYISKKEAERQLASANYRKLESSSLSQTCELIENHLLELTRKKPWHKPHRERLNSISSPKSTKAKPIHQDAQSC